MKILRSRIIDAKGGTYKCKIPNFMNNEVFFAFGKSEVKFVSAFISIQKFSRAPLKGREILVRHEQRIMHWKLN